MLLLSDGRYGIVNKIFVEHLTNVEVTYNFEVADFHTYYVGEHGVCVHNRCERAAMRAAKRSENISMNEKPFAVYEKNVVGANGRTYTSKTLLYKNDKFIRNDFGGHIFPDGAVLPKHFNAGTWSGTMQNPVLNGNGFHFWYT